MHPALSTYRVDLLTKSFPTLKQQLQQQHQQQQPQQRQPATDQAPAGHDSMSQPVLFDDTSYFTEPWFNMEGASMQLPEQLVSSWHDADVSSDLSLPPPNPYLPCDFSIKHQQMQQQEQQPLQPQQPCQQQQSKQQQQQDGNVHTQLMETGNGHYVRMYLQSPASQGSEAAALDADCSYSSVDSWLAGLGLDVVLSAPPTLVVDQPGNTLTQCLAHTHIMAIMNISQYGLAAVATMLFLSWAVHI